MKLTEAGATFPYGKDPKDSNLRIAPSYPPLSELKRAAQVLCLCVKLSAVEKALAERGFFKGINTISLGNVYARTGKQPEKNTHREFDL